MKHWLKIALLSAVPVVSSAHTMSPFVLPEVFDTKSNNVSFQSGITVEKFYAPTLNFKTNYVITLPNGSTKAVSPAASLKRFNIAEFDLPEEGTYRIRTEGAEGNAGQYALVDGRWLRVRAARPMTAAQQNAPVANAATPAPAQPPRMITANQVPANAQKLDVKNVYIAESFVTKNKPTAVPKINKQGFEVELLTHPNQLFVGESFKGRVLYNGKPVKDLEVDVFKGASTYEPNANREQPHVKTNKNGEFEVNFKDAGLYLITTAYPEVNSDNTKKPAPINYTYSLAVEVTE